MSFLKWSLLLVGGWLCFLGLGYVFQRKLIYFPPNMTTSFLDDLARDNGFSIWKSQGTEGERYGYIRRPQSPRGTVVFFHGNAEHTLNQLDFACQFDGHDRWTLALLEYPGYPGMGGTASENAIKRLATEAVRTLASERPLVLVGRSLGAAVAVTVAHDASPDVLILLSPFSSLADVAKAHYPMFFPQLILTERWDNQKALKKVRCPILFIHGKDDQVVPQKLGRKLYDSYSGKKGFVELQGLGHNDLPVWDRTSVLWKSLDAFLEQHIRFGQQKPIR